VDVYRGTAPPARRLSDFTCFVALFPHLIAGPIVRYNTIADQFGHRQHTYERFASGVALFILGFAKKILLANAMGRIADVVFAADSPDALTAWWGLAAYAGQIYFDFSGYSDIAVGLGRMVGFEIPRNFNSPYLSRSLTEFWQRWHMSLSSFLRDYLYFPLGGNRYGARRSMINLWLVMLIGGLWHGASWKFVLWGAYHGLWLALERGFAKRDGACGRSCRGRCRSRSPSRWCCWRGCRFGRRTGQPPWPTCVPCSASARRCRTANWCAARSSPLTT